ncbi:hypothetical protein V6N13_026333 [Hibiscus sabdariffa]|uniref:Uncharacterized protein n=1 Tax=Hibiscus sabdariffa TaxID=183260 RepID=A0ABR2P622_9ROSI
MLGRGGQISCRQANLTMETWHPPPSFMFADITDYVIFSLLMLRYFTSFSLCLLPKVLFYSIKFTPIPRFTVIHYFYSNPVQVDGSP